MTFTMYSAQTGNTFGVIEAASEDAALDIWAARFGYASRAEMWARGRWEYISAVRCAG